MLAVIRGSYIMVEAGTTCPDWITDVTAWWVNRGGSTRGGRTVHLPASVAPDTDADPTDPTTEPEPEPICDTMIRTDTGYWRTKPLAVLPPDWRPLCISCRIIADKLHESGELPEIVPGPGSGPGADGDASD